MLRSQPESSELGSDEAARSEVIRHKVRELMEPILDPDENGGLPVDELLLQALNFVAGHLALMTLDEPAGLKVRRLGRRMEVERIMF